MVKVVYNRTKSALGEGIDGFYDRLETYVQWTYEPYYDKDELHKAVNKFKLKSQLASLKAELDLTKDKGYAIVDGKPGIWRKVLGKKVHLKIRDGQVQDGQEAYNEKYGGSEDYGTTLEEFNYKGKTYKVKTDSLLKGRAGFSPIDIEDAAKIRNDVRREYIDEREHEELQKEYGLKFDGDDAFHTNLEYYEDFARFFDDFVEIQKKDYRWKNYEKFNKRLADHYNKYRIAYRGTTIQELESVQEIGLHPAIDDVDVDDEVSHFSISPEAAARFGPIILKFEDTYKRGFPVKYIPAPEAVYSKDGIKITEIGEHASGHYMHECEVRLPHESEATLKEVIVPVSVKDSQSTLHGIIDAIRETGWEGKIEFSAS